MRAPLHVLAVLLVAMPLGWQPAQAAGKNSAKRGKPVEITVKPRRTAADTFLTLGPGELSRIRRAFQLNARPRILPPFLGDGLTGPGKTINVSTEGTATYQRSSPPILVGDSAGRRQIEATVDIKATFQDGQSSVHGRISFGQSKLAAGGIPGAFGIERSNGGAVASGMIYNGAFYGSNAAETAGAFQIRANDVSWEAIQLVGGFGGSR